MCCNVGGTELRCPLRWWLPSVGGGRNGKGGVGATPLEHDITEVTAGTVALFEFET